MPIEIELKAWVDKPEEIRERVSRLAVYTGEFLKEDTYWHPRSMDSGGLPSPSGKLPFAGVFPPAGVRIRRESTVQPDGSQSQIVLVTFKTKEIREGIEVNREREFEISAAAPFEELLGLLGLEPAAGKRKTGGAWKYREPGGEPDITAELLAVEGLGSFLELEICADDDDPETVAAARKRLLGLLARTGIEKDRIETRYYTEMLRRMVQ
jgi:adenylate cyclase class 2